MSYDYCLDQIKPFRKGMNEDARKAARDLFDALYDGDAVERLFSKRVKEEINLLWKDVEAELVFSHIRISDPNLAVMPRRISLFKAVKEGIEFTDPADLHHTEAALKKCLALVQKAMKEKR